MFDQLLARVPFTNLGVFSTGWFFCAAVSSSQEFGAQQFHVDPLFVFRRWLCLERGPRLSFRTTHTHAHDSNLHTRSLFLTSNRPGETYVPKDIEEVTRSGSVNGDIKPSMGLNVLFKGGDKNGS